MENFDLYKQVSAFLEKDIKNWSYINTIEVLLDVAEGFQNENGLMAEKAAEKEQAFEQFMQIIEEQKETIRAYKFKEILLIEQLKLKTEEMKELKKSVRFEVFQENYELAKENARLKELVKA
jgi:hypothetical protein